MTTSIVRVVAFEHENGYMANEVPIGTIIVSTPLQLAQAQRVYTEPARWLKFFGEDGKQDFGDYDRAEAYLYAAAENAIMKVLRSKPEGSIHVTHLGQRVGISAVELQEILLDMYKKDMVVLRDRNEWVYLLEPESK
jgi:hypothetical protein